MKTCIFLFLTLLSANLLAKPKADIAILLDTSGSMQSLINQVRDGLWQTLNGLGEIKRDGEVAELRLALYEYGSGVVSEEANFIQMLAPLTSDHTVIAEKLFATVAQGGTEYSGMAIELATKDLDFSKDLSDFKTIVIAGNETIHQGPISPLDSAAKALSEDIIVNAIFAGAQTTIVRPSIPKTTPGACRFFCTPSPSPTPLPRDPETVLNPIFGEWREMAKAGGGKTLNIDHTNAIPHIESPFDKRIVEATEEISETYLPFGKDGQIQYKRMRDLDKSVRSSGNGSYIGWGSYRSGHFGQKTYATWDLVSALRANKLDLSQIADKDLPEKLRGLSLEEKLEIVKATDLKRKSLEDEIAELRKKRKEFVDKEIAKKNKKGADNFTEAIKKILVKQLTDKGFSLSSH